MDIATILDQLGEIEHVPVDALRAASERRDEMLPHFLAAISDFLIEPTDDEATGQRLFYIFHLLGEWREKSAYRPLARLLRGPSDKVDLLLDWALENTVHRVMASVFDGDPQPLFDIALDRSASEYVRSPAFEALAIAVLYQGLDRDVVHRFFTDSFTALQPDAGSYVWYGWQRAIAVLGMSDLTKLVETAFEREFIDLIYAELSDFVEDLSLGIDHPDAATEYALFDDTIGFWTAWFDRTKLPDDFSYENLPRKEFSYDDIPDPVTNEPYVNPLRNVGRNDPCPCGSGKKYKKCCLA
jgi:hypothetical protein